MENIKERTKTEFEKFKKDGKLNDSNVMKYPTFLNGIIRKIIHNIADEFDLNHISIGKSKSNKYIEVSIKQ